MAHPALFQPPPTPSAPAAAGSATAVQPSPPSPNGPTQVSIFENWVGAEQSASRRRPGHFRKSWKPGRFPVPYILLRDTEGRASDWLPEKSLACTPNLILDQPAHRLHRGALPPDSQFCILPNCQRSSERVRSRGQSLRCAGEARTSSSHWTGAGESAR